MASDAQTSLCVAKRSAFPILMLYSCADTSEDDDSGPPKARATRARQYPKRSRHVISDDDEDEDDEDATSESE